VPEQERGALLSGIGRGGGAWERWEEGEGEGEEEGESAERVKDRKESVFLLRVRAQPLQNVQKNEAHDLFGRKNLKNHNNPKPAGSDADMKRRGRDCANLHQLHIAPQPQEALHAAAPAAAAAALALSAFALASVTVLALEIEPADLLQLLFRGSKYIRCI
jgi:hypothetical protein